MDHLHLSIDENCEWMFSCHTFHRSQNTLHYPTNSMIAFQRISWFLCYPDILLKIMMICLRTIHGASFAMKQYSTLHIVSYVHLLWTFWIKIMVPWTASKTWALLYDSIYRLLREVAKLTNEMTRSWFSRTKILNAF